MHHTPLIRSSIPSFAEFVIGLLRLWKSKRLSNNGWYAKALSQRIKGFLGTKNASLVSSGTMALSISYKALGLKGKVITTPYSFIATSSSLVWDSLEPKFVDIEQDGYGIDPGEVLRAITPDTSAILAVHPYGIPCNFRKISQIGRDFNIPVIYDAAQAFGVSVNGESILNQGDISVCSLHATKVFHTCEGGLIVCSSEELSNRVEAMKNFGFTGELQIDLLGINGKVSELNALMGYTLLKKYDAEWRQRETIHRLYCRRLEDMEHVALPTYPDDVISNYSYFPINCNVKKIPGLRDSLYNELRSNGIEARKYFYPLLSDVGYLREAEKVGDLKNAKERAEGVLCLPIYGRLKLNKVRFICDIFRAAYEKACRD